MGGCFINMLCVARPQFLCCGIVVPSCDRTCSVRIIGSVFVFPDEMGREDWENRRGRKGMRREGEGEREAQTERERDINLSSLFQVSPPPKVVWFAPFSSPNLSI